MHEILILIIYQVVIVIIMILVVRLIKHVYRLLILTIYRCQADMLEKIAVQLKIMEIK